MMPTDESGVPEKTHYILDTLNELGFQTAKPSGHFTSTRKLHLI